MPLHLKQIKNLVKHKKISKYYDHNCSNVRRRTDEIEILITYRNIDRKDAWTSLKNTDVEPPGPVQIKMYQSNTYRKDLDWLHFDN